MSYKQKLCPLQKNLDLLFLDPHLCDSFVSLSFLSSFFANYMAEAISSYFLYKNTPANSTGFA